MMAGNVNYSDEKKQQLAMSLELLHSASLIHDDVIDGDTMRRGQAVMNVTYGNKVAVLAGDTLFSKAFDIVTDEFPKAYARKISALSYEMCLAELIQAQGIGDRAHYYKVIIGKTALFMKTCCELGAMFAGGNKEDVAHCGAYGLNFGIAYQIYDDIRDHDENLRDNATTEDVKTYAMKALQAIEDYPQSDYKDSMIALVNMMI